jgi:hypothetical protein
MSVPGGPHGPSQRRYPGNHPPGQQGVPPSQGPLTRPGLGALPAAVGVVLELAALFVVPWVTFSSGDLSASLSFLDLVKAANDTTLATGFSGAYVKFLGFIATGATVLGVMPWTLGALRTGKSAFLLSGIRRKQLTRTSFWWYRVVFAGRAVVMLAIHVAGIAVLFSDDFDQLGPGPWLMFGGAALVIAGAALGPRKAPALPR